MDLAEQGKTMAKEYPRCQASFSPKYHLAKAFLRWTQVHEAADLTDVERNSWVDLIKRVNQALR